MVALHFTGKHVKQLIGACALAGACISLSTTADVLTMPDEAASNQQGYSMPSRGMSKDQVQQKFGPANSEHGPTGEPPIYFWEYSNFTVYFESDYVIHAVNKQKSALKK